MKQIAPLPRSARRVLRLLGNLYGHLLKAYTDITLSLSEQLVHLSAASHIILAIYNQDKGEFIPVQTCFDTSAMIKNIYFCVAKVQIDNPDGEFFVILVGSDGLEKTFGKVRTMVGNDTHADQFQLTNRIDGAVKCVNILEEHPEWGVDKHGDLPGSLFRRIWKIYQANTTISAQNRGKEMWYVKNVVLSGCWAEGRRKAEQDLTQAILSLLFGDGEGRWIYDDVPFWR